MSENSIGLDDLKEDKEIERREDFDRDHDHDVDMNRINESRETDYEQEDELEHGLLSNDEYDDLEDSLEDGIESVEEGLGWIEAGASAIGGGVPMMEGGVNFEDAIRDALEEEFSPDEMAQSGVDEAKNQEVKQKGPMHGLIDNSGPEMQPKKGGK